MSLFNPFDRSPLTVGQAILAGTVVAGVLDATDGVVAYGLLLGLNPIQVLQFIASGALGASAFTGGIPTALAGMLFHFFIAVVVTAIYVLASRAIPVLKSQAIVFGLIYGAAINLTMTYLILPLTALAPSAFSLPLFLNGLIGHALFVGLPIALFARRVQ